MLRLRRLEVEGFGPFADRAVLEFPDQPGVTVVYGDNMRGKTSLMNAIRYAFFGEVQGRGERTRGVLAACNRDLTAEGRYGFSIGLELRYEDTDFKLMRSVEPKVGKPGSDLDFTRIVSLRRGFDVLGSAEAGALLRAMLPKEVARFFLFDGELLDQYAELLVTESESGRTISEAIEQILGVPMLRQARDHLGMLASAASRASAREASKHRSTQALGVGLQKANDMKDAHEQERDRKARELEDLLGQRDETETELRYHEASAAAVERLDGARKDLEAAQAVQAVKGTELKVAMREAWRTLLDEPVATAGVAAQEAVKEAFGSLRTSLRLQAIEHRHCRICDQDVPKDVLSRLTASLPPDLTAANAEDHAGLAAFARRAELDAFEQKDVRAEVRLICEAVRSARIDEADARGRIADANKILEDQDPAGLRRLGTRLAELGGKIGAAREAIDAEQERVDDQNASIARLAKKLQDAGAPELAALQQRERLLARARVIFVNAVERYKAALRDRVEASATDLFLQLTTEKEDYVSLGINNHYGLTIIHRDGEVEEGRSAGAEQVVALALMGALQANAPLRGPIVMDTPFGRLDPQHTANVVSALPSMAEQVVLFVQEGEIDRATVRELLGDHLVSEYQLDKETARRTLVTEAR